MPSLRFLISRRWVLFTLAVILAAWATWWLGNWQFRRLEETKTQNATIRANENATPVDVTTVLPPGSPVTSQLEWRRVSATGEYDASRTTVVRYRTREGNPGLDVVVPLHLTTGQWLLVDRGWMPVNGPQTPALPAPPSGQVTVTGYLRADGTGDSTRVDNRSMRAINSQRIGAAVGLTPYAGFLAAGSESPPAATKLLGPELPDLGNGPHFFYGLQWWFFGLLAIFGYFYLMYDESRGGPARKKRESQTSEHSPVDGEHHAGQK